LKYYNNINVGRKYTLQYTEYMLKKSKENKLLVPNLYEKQ